MPLIEVENTEKHKVALWKITESAQELESGFPGSALNTYAHPSRQIQYLSSRLLLMQLLQSDDIEWFSNEMGKIELSNDARHVSISHSNHFAAAICADENTGIDIEKMDERILKIAPKFVNEQEWDYFERKDIESLYKIWCAKECMFKWYGKGAVDFRRHLCVNLSVAGSNKLEATMIKPGVRQRFSMTCVHPESDFLLVWINASQYLQIDE